MNNKRRSTKITEVPEEVVRAESLRLRALWDNAKHTVKPALTQREFGDKYEVGGQAYVQQLLNGSRPLNIRIAEKFAAYLRCRVGDFSERLQTEIDRIGAAAVTSDAQVAEMLSIITPERGEFLRRLSMLTDDKQREIIERVNSEYTTVMQILRKLGGPGSHGKVSRMTSSNQKIQDDDDESRGLQRPNAT